MSDQYVESVLYDLDYDPYELTNLIGFESHAPIQMQLRERLLVRMAEAGDPPPEIKPAPTRISGQRRLDANL
jgi:hypothetical protein